MQVVMLSEQLQNYHSFAFQKLYLFCITKKQQDTEDDGYDDPNSDHYIKGDTGAYEYTIIDRAILHVALKIDLSIYLRVTNHGVESLVESEKSHKYVNNPDNLVQKIL